MRFFSALILLSFSLSALSNEPRVCKESKSPLFQAGANDDLKIEIISDFNHINKTNIKNYDPYAPGVMAYKKSDGTWEYLALQVNARGNSRYRNCEYRPLKLIFEGEDYTQNLLSNIKVTGNVQEDISSLYNQLIQTKGVTRWFSSSRKANRFRLFIGEENKKNIFKKTDEDIKLVTHCGKSSWYENGHNVLGGKEKEEQERKLLQEHYIYQLIGTLQTTSLKTRLATITYRDHNGDELLTRKAFFLEDPKKMAKRCELKKGRGNTKNAQSSFQIDFLNRFVFNNDYYLNEFEAHNLMLYHNKAKETFLIGYDYDLSGLIDPNYKKNTNDTIDSHRENFKEWLDTYDFGPVEIPMIQHLLTQKPKMKEIIDNSYLSEDSKDQMNYWLESYTQMLGPYIR